MPPAKPRKSLGQHFLVDNRIGSRILAAARLTPADTVVEIGPGRGALTRGLLARVSRVVAVELDETLATNLAATLNHPANLSVVQADARTLDLSGAAPTDSPYKVVANLPYYAANPIVRHLLECENPPALLVVMVQREVAESMTARPGKMSLLAVATQFYARAELICSVAPAAFRPAPKVTSAVVRLERRPRPAVAVPDTGCFFDLVRAGFSAPRKQLRNSLSHGLGLAAARAADILLRAEVDGRRRAETLSLAEWGAVYREWAGCPESPGLVRSEVKVC